MKIAYFLGTLKKEDGVTRVLLSLIHEQQKIGIESIIITGWAEDETTVPVPVIQIPSFVFPLYKEYKIPFPGMRGFEKQLDVFKPDIVHVHSPDPVAWAALKYAKKNKIPIVATYHTDFSKYLPYYHALFLRPLIWLILRNLYRKMNLVTATSWVAREQLEENGVHNTLTIPWGVESEKFNPSFYSEEWRDKILNKKNGNIILCVCRLTWEKNLKTLVATYNLLREHKKDFSMIIVGDGPIRRELECLIPGVIFTGHLEGERLSTAYASSDIFLFPSDTETFGNVTIEAVASGLPCVVANKGGSKTIIKDKENGFLAQPKNAKDFYEKVVLLLEDKNLREKMKNKGLIISKDYTWVKVSENFTQEYSKLLS